jgi:glycosyltransferase involved in cell wall biosynthesis
MNTRRLVLAASAPDEAARALADRGLDATAVLDKNAFLQPRAALREQQQATTFSEAIAYARSWKHQLNPQLYELGLALAPARRLYLADDDSHELRRISRVSAAAGASTIPFSFALGLARASVFGVRAAARRRSPARTTSKTRSGILGIWLSDDATVGGSVSHISGILGGFRQLGFRVGLVALTPPPPQVAAVIDDLELVPPLPRRSRLLSDFAGVAANDGARIAAAQLARRLDVAFVYQRHRAFLSAGAGIAERLEVPLVLEWNGSEAWKRQHWYPRGLFDRLLDPVVRVVERDVVCRSSLIVSVSKNSEAMAYGAGAPHDRVIVVPNGVDARHLVELAARAARLPGRTVGWIGSFYPWHGMEAMISAVSLLPVDVRLLMIGSGPLFDECRQSVRREGLDGRVDFVGALPRDDALTLLAGSTVLASPHVPTPDSLFFGSPTKVFEYMALGRPIVASRLEQIGEILEDGVTARLVDPDNHRSLAAALREILDSPDLAMGLGTEAQRQALALHTWDQRASKILEALGITLNSEKERL